MAGAYDVLIEVTHGLPGEEERYDRWALSVAQRPSWARSRYVQHALYEAALAANPAEGGVAAILTVVAAKKANENLPGQSALVVETLMEVAAALNVSWQPPLWYGEQAVA